MSARLRPLPRPGPGQLLLRVRACGVCRTDLYLVDGEDFMALAERVPIATEVSAMPFDQAQHALDRLRSGNVVGAIALVTGASALSETRHP